MLVLLKHFDIGPILLRKSFTSERRGLGLLLYTLRLHAAILCCPFRSLLFVKFALVQVVKMLLRELTLPYMWVYLLKGDQIVKGANENLYEY